MWSNYLFPQEKFRVYALKKRTTTVDTPHICPIINSKNNPNNGLFINFFKSVNGATKNYYETYPSINLDSVFQL